MKLYRYNAQKRTHRKFNTCGSEKNPGRVAFYAKTMDYAREYKDIYDRWGEFMYSCELQVEELKGEKLFDMEESYKSLDSYKAYIADKIAIMMKDYTEFHEKAETKKKKKMWASRIERLKDGTEEMDLQKGLKLYNFQFLSDGKRQASLIAELKALGFDGYETKQEVAIF